MTTLGAVFVPQFAPERLRTVAQAAEEAGLEELWLWEDCFLEGGIASAAAVLAWTTRLKVGVGLLPVPLRNVALTAMEVATLHRLFPGRPLVGVGHGVQDWMKQVGVKAESPVTLLREYVTALRSLLRGEEVTVTGRYVQLDHVALGWPPELLAGAIGPRSLRLCGEHADGTILTGDTPPDGVKNARLLIDEGRATGRRTEQHPITVYLVAATGPGAADRLDKAGLVNDAAVAGDASAVAAAVIRLAQAGADTVVLQPTSDEPDPEGFVRFVGEGVRPLVP
jgi:alkanesulfonate monooxygenase SsuD/methylene tetrahydromethanopterin reductase-like flavin-dependent oxidoreductase (luciferase family)